MKQKLFILLFLLHCILSQSLYARLPVFYRWAVLFSSVGYGNKVIQEYTFHSDPYYLAKKYKRRWQIVSILSSFAVDEKTFNELKEHKKELYKTIIEKKECAADLLLVPGNCKEAAKLYKEAVQGLNEFYYQK